VLLVITGPIASGKSTLARAVARDLDEQGMRTAAVDLDLVYEMLDPFRAPKTDDAKWTQARRISARLADVLIADGVAVIVEGDFQTAEKRADLTDALSISTGPRFLTLRTSFELTLQRARQDPTRGISRDPGFLRDHYERTGTGTHEAPPTDLVLDTGVMSVSEASAAVGDWLRRGTASPME
jgi:chloramphenicol 3-O-phosphotransferase